jgi:carboxylesterase
MGAMLAARLAADQREAVAGLVMLAPAFFLPTAAQLALRLISPARAWGDRVYIRSGRGSDIHDDAARSIHPGTRLMPLGAVFSLLDLSDRMRPRLGEVVQPTLLIHSRRDHTCPYERNVNLVMRHLGSVEKRAVALEESFHVITVDSEKNRVAQETLDFVAPFRIPARLSANG